MKKIILLCTALVVLSSCTTTKKNIEKEYIHDTVISYQYRDRIKYDSIYMHDSIYIYTKNDTVFKDKFEYLYKYIYKYDTVYVSDTINNVQYVNKEIVKEKNNRSIFKWITIFIILGVLLLYVSRTLDWSFWIKKFLKK